MHGREKKKSKLRSKTTTSISSTAYLYQNRHNLKKKRFDNKPGGQHPSGFAQALKGSNRGYKIHGQNSPSSPLPLRGSPNKSSNSPTGRSVKNRSKMKAKSTGIDNQPFLTQPSNRLSISNGNDNNNSSNDNNNKYNGKRKAPKRTRSTSFVNENDNNINVDESLPRKRAKLSSRATQIVVNNNDNDNNNNKQHIEKYKTQEGRTSRHHLMKRNTTVVMNDLSQESDSFNDNNLIVSDVDSDCVSPIGLVRSSIDISNINNSNSKRKSKLNKTVSESDLHFQQRIDLCSNTPLSESSDIWQDLIDDKNDTDKDNDNDNDESLESTQIGEIGDISDISCGMSQMGGCIDIGGCYLSPKSQSSPLESMKSSQRIQITPKRSGSEAAPMLLTPYLCHSNGCNSNSNSKANANSNSVKPSPSLSLSKKVDLSLNLDSLFDNDDDDDNNHNKNDEYNNENKVSVIGGTIEENVRMNDNNMKQKNSNSNSDCNKNCNNDNNASKNVDCAVGVKKTVIVPQLNFERIKRRYVYIFDKNVNGIWSDNDLTVFKNKFSINICIIHQFNFWFFIVCMFFLFICLFVYLFD